jgi:glycosyltransferase involved in cell wall biosynthesis
MKLLLVHESYQQPGGEDQVFASEVELLASHGHEVLRYTAHNDAVRQLNKLALACRTSWSQTTYQDMRAVLQRERPQIVHVHNTLPLLSPAVYYAAGAARVPVVQTLHNYRLLCPRALLLREQRICEDCVGRRVAWPGVVHACYRQSRGATGAVAVMLGLHRLLGTWSRRVNRYIALTEFMRQKFIQGGFSASQIVVKPNFVSPDPRVGDHDGGYALFVGRLSPEKGVQTLLHAWRRHGCMPLKIAGEGPLQNLADGSPPGVEWLGRQPHEEVVALMKQALVLVFPSECYEGFPAAIAEAFATGLPVVASRLGAMGEIVRDRQTGLLFTPGDANDLGAKIAWARGHPADLVNMGRRARDEFERKYTAERNYQLLRDIYDGVLDSSSFLQRSSTESPDLGRSAELTQPSRPVTHLRHSAVPPHSSKVDALVSGHLRAQPEPREAVNTNDATRVRLASSTRRYKDFPPGWGHIKVPVSSRSAALAGLALYTPCLPRGIWAQRAATVCVAIVGPRVLPGPSFPWIPMSEMEWLELSEALRREVGVFDDVAGYSRLQVSRAGVALLLLHRGSPTAFVKLRRGDSGSLANEKRALDAVWSYRPRTFQIPEPLQFGCAGGWHYLVSAPLPPGLRRPPRNPPLPTILEEIDAALDGLPRPPEAPDHWRPMHGDFAPWNLRELRRGSLALIDWENAGWAPPGADEILYRATWAAISRRAPARCASHEAVEFWRERVPDRPDSARDERLARALHEILRWMAVS